MSWQAEETVTVRCPRCGSPVNVPVYIDHVDIVNGNSLAGDTMTVRVWFVQQINVDRHVCSDPTPPIERFVKHGQLDDPVRS